MTFTLTIELGNAEMQTFDHIARALRQTADRFDNEHDLVEEADPYDRRGIVRDINGNTVGKYEAR